MKLVVGLGNPGPDYDNSRHNMGFKLIDMLAEDLDVSISKKGFKGLYAKVNAFDDTIYLLKPMTYMNLSGESVKEFISYFKINIEDIIVLVDDLALEPGRFRLREKGSSGGQKGLGNIIDLLGTNEIKRIRIGIGEPKYDIVDYVLSKPSLEEQEEIDKALDEALLALKYALKVDFNKASSLFNKKKK